jgi:hypothetical protein
MTCELIQDAEGDSVSNDLRSDHRGSDAQQEGAAGLSDASGFLRRKNLDCERHDAEPGWGPGHDLTICID